MMSHEDGVIQRLRTGSSLEYAGFDNVIIAMVRFMNDDVDTKLCDKCN